MEERKTNHRKKHPKVKSNCISHFFFGWELPLLLKIRKKPFNQDSTYEVLKEHRGKNLGDKLEKLWMEETNFKKTPSLTRAIWKLIGADLCFYGGIFLPLDLGITLLQPFCLQRFLIYFTQSEMTTKLDAYIFASGFLFLQLLRVLSFHWMCLQLTSVGIKVRVALCSLIYRKSLKLKRETLEKFTVGQIVNLLSNDVNRFNEAFVFLHLIWSSPIKLLAVACYLYLSLGYTAVNGVAITVFCFFIQVFIFKKMTDKRMQVAGKTDHRIRLMNDIISGIQTIKMYTWEKPFSKIIQTARKIEMNQISSANLLRITINTFRSYLSKLSVFSCILIVVLQKINLTPEYYFPLINIYDALNMSVVQRVQGAIVNAADARTSVFRIQKFLLSENKLEKNQKTNVNGCITRLNSFKKKETEIYFRNVTLTNSAVLKSVNLHVLPRELVGICGPAGSGKSTLLQLILKEIEPDSESISVEGTLSYSPQESWIFSASIRQNILFGQKMDEERYKTVLRVCALEHDLSLFPDADQTLVGERGVLLSGGQKARINLARAVYREVDFYLLDDPLAAVDAHVAQHIFQECILGFLKDKSVVLVTHRVNFLERATRVYFIDNGKVDEKSAEQDVIADNGNSIVQTKILKQNRSVNEISEKTVSAYSTLELYKKFCFSARREFTLFAILFLFCLSSSLDTFINYFVAFQTNLDNPEGLNFRNKPETFLEIYGCFCIALIIVNHVQSFLFVSFLSSVTKLFHDSMLKRIFLVAVSFFYENVSGRILNRFSQDVGCIDEIVPYVLHIVLKALFDCLNVLIIVSFLNYWLIIPSVILFGMFYGYAIFFEPISQNLRHSEAITKSPIFSHMVTTVRGLTTIRAFNTQNILLEEFDNHQDLHSSVFYLFKSCYYTFTFWVDVTCFFYTVAVTYSFLLFDNTTSTSNVGLAVCQANTLIGLVQFGMKIWTDLNAHMTSVERVIEYQELPPEEDNGTFEPPEWPQFGKIEFKEVSLRYHPDKPLVLKNINLMIKSREKVGVVGRTGAGKTSLVSLLFRLFDFEGQVLIDNVDTKSVPLSFLRSKIFVIPQDPVLFVGTLRKNLDPFEEFSESQIWNTLESVYLKDMVSKLPLGLETLVLENGTNFSVGQKQLLCLSRAILRNTKIVVFDEATANIDLETDTLIQSTIRSKFKDSTVLTIAHRLDTVMDSDKILVMDDGAVVEFDTPEVLLKNRQGLFYKLIYQRNS